MPIRHSCTPRVEQRLVEAFQMSLSRASCDAAFGSGRRAVKHDDSEVLFRGVEIEDLLADPGSGRISRRWRRSWGSWTSSPLRSTRPFGSDLSMSDPSMKPSASCRSSQKTSQLRLGLVRRLQCDGRTVGCRRDRPDVRQQPDGSEGQGQGQDFRRALSRHEVE